MPDLRPVFFVVGLMVAALGIAMFAPMAVDLAYNDRSWRTFAISAILTTLLGAVLALANYTPKPDLRVSIDCQRLCIPILRDPELHSNCAFLAVTESLSCAACRRRPRFSSVGTTTPVITNQYEQTLS